MYFHKSLHYFFIVWLYMGFSFFSTLLVWGSILVYYVLLEGEQNISFFFVGLAPSSNYLFSLFGYLSSFPGESALCQTFCW